MKRFSWRGAVVATIMATTTGLVSAQSWSEPPIPNPGNDATRLTWAVGVSDTYILDFADVVKAQVGVLAPATVPVQPTMVGAEPVGVTVYFPALATAHDAVTGLATAVSSAGGVQITVPKIIGLAVGGQLTLTNWTIDATTLSLTADISGSHGVPSQSQVAVFTLGNVVVTGANTSFNLWLTQTGVDAFAQAVGLQGSGIFNAMQELRTHSFGTVSVDVAMVPEPSSIALMLAGLSAVATAAHRRRRKPAEAQPA